MCYYLSTENMSCMRWVFAVLAFLGIAGCNILRYNISVVMTVIARADHDSSRSDDDTTSVQTTFPSSNSSSFMTLCESGDSNASLSEFEEPEFQWSSHTQELLLAAFFIGYTPMQPCAGWLVDRFGGKWLLGGGICLSATMNLLSPVAAKTAVPLLFAVRMLSGVGEAFSYPGVNALVTKWSPANEQSRMMAFIVSGLGLGGAFGQIVSGQLCAYVAWESTFYVFGGSMFVWFVFWSILVYEEPGNHPCISEEEVTKIETRRTRGLKINLKSNVPVLSMLTSLPAIAWYAEMVTIAGFVMFILLTNIPLYLKHVQGLSVNKIGLLMGIPYVVHWLVTIVTSYVSDLLVNRKYLSRTNTRKLVINIGAIVCAGSLLGIAHAGCSLVTAVALMTTAMGGIGVAVPGIFVNPTDLAPRFAGTLFGIGNALSVSTGFIGPVIVASLTEDQDDPRGWANVFYLTSGLTLLGALVFQLMGSGDEQEWAKDLDEAKRAETKEGCKIDIVEETKGATAMDDHKPEFVDEAKIATAKDGCKLENLEEANLLNNDERCV